MCPAPGAPPSPPTPQRSTHRPLLFAPEPTGPRASSPKGHKPAVGSSPSQQPLYIRKQTAIHTAVPSFRPALVPAHRALPVTSLLLAGGGGVGGGELSYLQTQSPDPETRGSCKLTPPCPLAWPPPHLSRTRREADVACSSAIPTRVTRRLIYRPPARVSSQTQFQDTDRMSRSLRGLRSTGHWEGAPTVLLCGRAVAEWSLPSVTCRGTVCVACCGPTFWLLPAQSSQAGEEPLSPLGLSPACPVPPSHLEPTRTSHTPTSAGQAWLTFITTLPAPGQSPATAASGRR